MRAVLLAVPFEPGSARVLDAEIRKTMGAHLDLPLRMAFARLEQRLAHRFDGPPRFAGECLARGPHRSLTAIALSTALEHAGLRWNALDPGAVSPREWGRLFARYRHLAPAMIAISTTFVTSRPFLVELIAQARRQFPAAVIAAGGYYYTTDAEGFLSLDADVFCVGEGEVRLPLIAQRVGADLPLDDVPGLYLRGEGGRLRHTGSAPALALQGLAAPDWRLAPRIDPPVAAEELPYHGFETQRGCAFMCAFCTYRTLAVPMAMTPELACERCFEMATHGARYIELYDATATSPKRRWKDFLNQLIARGGSPVPIGAFARVSDIDSEAADAMRRAGVRHLFIGQESGDQRLLNAMRKGTRVSDVQPAVDLLGQHGITLTFGLIHGFPGEDAASLANTRRLLTRVNAGRPDHPTVFSYDVVPFALQDFAAVSQDPMLQQDAHHFLSHRFRGFSVADACREILETIIHSSRTAHAPVAHGVFQRSLALPTSVIAVSPQRNAIFRWAKALERGVAIELERMMHGRRPDRAERERVHTAILAPFDGPAGRGAAWLARLEACGLRALCGEWQREADAGPGPLTRALTRAITPRSVAPPEREVAHRHAQLHADRLLSTVDRRYQPKRLSVV